MVDFGLALKCEHEGVEARKSLTPRDMNPYRTNDKKENLVPYMAWDKGWVRENRREIAEIWEDPQIYVSRSNEAVLGFVKETDGNVTVRCNGARLFTCEEEKMPEVKRQLVSALTHNAI